MTLYQKWLITVILIFTLFLGTGCDSQISPVKEKIIIADQFGLAYAPLEVMKANGFLEEALNEAGLEVEIVWQKFGNTTAIREAMVSGDLDVGFVGIPPFLIGLDNGMDWKIISGLSESQVALICKDPTVNGLEDLTKAHRIILPQPGSIQHILLQMAAENLLGNYAAFDEQLIALSHPDGVVAFTSGGPDQLHFTAPPYIEEDLRIENAKVILEGKDAVGEDYTFIVGICHRNFFEQKAYYKAFNQALKRSIDEIQQGSEETLKLLSDVYGLSVEQINESLLTKSLTYSDSVKGLNRFTDFMFKSGTLSKKYASSELIWE